MTAQIIPPENHKQIASLDFRNDHQSILMSYLLRAIGAVIFGMLFYMAPRQMYPDMALTFKALITIAIEGVPDLISLGLMGLAVAFVLWLHELVHAIVFFIHTGAPPRIGTRGLMIFASAEDHLNARNAMIVNALAPFATISAIGLLLMTIVPAAVLPWVFIPTVANAAAAGGDFMAAYWLISLPGHAKIEDHGDLLIAYQTAAY